MKNIRLLVLLLFIPTHLSFGQESITKLAKQMIELSTKRRQNVQFGFSDPLRVEWRRTPGVRNGVSLYKTDLQQKKIIHQLLSLSLSTSGYNKITHILFNEDLSKEFDPQTGQNRYWLAIYGQPAENNKWGWRLEGHHLSIHFTLFGDEILSTTPFEVGSYPAVVEKDTVRAGFRNLSKEIDLGFDLINSLNPAQLKKAILSKVRPNERLMGESYSLSSKEPLGLSFKEMNATQQGKLIRLANEYLGNFEPLDKIDYSLLYLAWWGPTDNSSTYWYRLHSKEFLIDFENIGNHIHCVVRFLKKDFGTNPYNN